MREISLNVSSMTQFTNGIKGIVKEKVEFWEEVTNIICERYHSYYASVEEHQIRHVAWKA